jgi:hypothetical protein
MKDAPATSSLIPPEKRGYFTPKQTTTGSHEGCASYVLSYSTCNKKLFYSEAKKSLAAMLIASATP